MTDFTLASKNYVDKQADQGEAVVLASKDYVDQHSERKSTLFVNDPIGLPLAYVVDFAGCCGDLNCDFPCISFINSYNSNIQFCSCNLTSFKGDFPDLESQSDFFADSYRLEKFEGNMPKCDSMYCAFANCHNLKSFKGEISGSLVTTNMFRECPKLNEFNSSIPSVKDANNMFYFCGSLKEFDSSAGMLEEGGSMFNNCISLSSFKGNLPNLDNGADMFNNCVLDKDSVHRIAETIKTHTDGGTHQITIGMDDSLSGDADVAADLQTIRDKGWEVSEQYNNPAFEFTGEIDEEDCSYYFYESPWRKIKATCSKCTRSDYMLGHSYNLTEAEITLGQSNGSLYGTFANCHALEKATINDSATTAGLNSTFFSCHSLKEITLNTGKIVDIGSAFSNCYSLKEIHCDFSNVTHANSAFDYCTALETFDSDLSSLNNGGWMFHSCVLDKDSVHRIAETIKTYTDGSSHGITIGVNYALKDDADVQADLDRITDKGWEVTTQFNIPMPQL